VSRHQRQRLLDVQAALDAIDAHVGRGDLTDGLVFDAVRVRLIEIGVAVKALPRELLKSEPASPERRSPGCVTNWPTATSTPPTPSLPAP
jgi:hypothetical protein